MRIWVSLIAVLCMFTSAQAATITPAFGKYSSSSGSVDAAKQNINTLQLLGAMVGKPGGKPTSFFGNFTDIRFFMDGQSGRPLYAQWRANQTTTDLTAVEQAAVNHAHGNTGVVFHPDGTFRINGTVYVQTDRTTGSAGAIWKPITLQGVATYKSNPVGGGGAGATILYKPTSGAMFSVNLDAAGAGMTATGAMMTHQFYNFAVADIAFKGEVGVQTTALKGYSTRANIRRVSFINLWRGWDFHDADVNGAENYCDMWDVDDVFFTGIGDHMFRHRGADASVFKNMKCESFQSTAVGGFRMTSGRGMQFPGLLVNGLPSTASYIGFFYYAHQVVLQGGHFERNYCSTGEAEFGQSSSGFLLNGVSGSTIHGEFFNPDGAAVTRPFIIAYDGYGNTFAGNTFRANRASGYDVAVNSDDTLVYANVTRNADDSPRTEATYFNPANTTTYGTLFKNVPLTAASATIDSISSGTLLINGDAVTGSGNGIPIIIQNRNFTASGAVALNLATGAASNSAGVFTAVSVNPDINQSGSAGYTALRVVATEVATGSGAKKLLSIGTNPASVYTEQFGVTNAGIVNAGGGSANKAICWKADGKTLGFCSTVVAADGSCTCN